MMRPLALLVPVLLLAFYHAAGQKLTTQIKAKSSRINIATIIEGRCAVVVRPDDKKIRLMKKGISDDNYMTLVSDNQYYMATATNFLDSIKVKQIEKLSSGMLKFRTSSGQYFDVSLGTFDWGIILFNGRTKPLTADVTNMEEEYRKYMKK